MGEESPSRPRGARLITDEVWWEDIVPVIVRKVHRLAAPDLPDELRLAWAAHPPDWVGRERARAD